MIFENVHEIRAKLDFIMTICLPSVDFSEGLKVAFLYFLTDSGETIA